MPVAFVLDFPDGSREQYEAVIEQMDLGGSVPPGALFHAAGPGPGGGLRVVDVWESDSAFQQFAEAKIMPLTAEAGLTAPAVLQFEIETVRDPGAPRREIEIVDVIRLPLDAAGFRDLSSEVIGDLMPEGMTYHVSGPQPGGGWMVISGWSSRAARDRFRAERVTPAFERRGMPTPEPEILEVYNALEPAQAISRDALMRWLDEQDSAFNRHDPDGVAAGYASDAVLHDQAAPEPVRGREGVREFVGTYLHAFPDMSWERVGVEIDGSTLVEQWRASGSHEGDLPGLPPTHRRMTVEGCSVMHFGADGLVHEEENYWDEAAMLRQLGAMPAATATS
jgi:steroid delta-isomerase-like uncharacterized protein